MFLSWTQQPNSFIQRTRALFSPREVLKYSFLLRIAVTDKELYLIAGFSLTYGAENTTGRFGSEPEVQALNSLTAASERKAATQNKLFNFPD
jgi:hypothetical protein